MDDGQRYGCSQDVNNLTLAPFNSAAWSQSLSAGRPQGRVLYIRFRAVIERDTISGPKN
jgi:hypothetical protein